jgi:hypothetical protein
MNVILPTLLSCAAGLVCFLVVFHEPSFQQLREPHEPSDGGAPRASEQASIARANLGAEIAILAVAIVGCLWSAIALWLIGRFLLAARFPLLKAIEIASLAQATLILSTVITALLVLATDDPNARPALSLFLSDFDPTNKNHAILASFNFFQLWSAGVLAVGLAKLSKVPFLEAAFWIYSYCLLGRLALILIR